jgi:LDH2 family malate/lactate/ureidoglycolate dehydrogenase
MLKSSPPAPGISRVLAPGEVEAAAESRNRKLGIPLPENVREQLVDLGVKLGVDFPCPADCAAG